ncbi:MAG: flagellar biosynthetic protein FliR [Bacillota bacterium]|nr:flagellar biosynthetic protein FliR [Candidatus Fermentithermobacillaceae bacterium]
MGDLSEAMFPFMCVFLRTTGVFVTAPVLAARFVPAAVKVGLSLIMSFFLLPSVEAAAMPGSYALMAGAFLGEIAYGLLTGFIAAALMAAVEVAGQVVDVQMGFGLSNVLDPEQGSSSPLMGIFKYLLMTLIFMALDGHHLFIRGLAQSFEVIPAGRATIASFWAALSVETVGRMLLIGVVLSLPVWASMLITDVGLGVIARAVPQMNVFVIGLPVKSLVGFMILSASVGFYGVFTEEITVTLRNLLENLLGASAL